MLSREMMNLGMCDGEVGRDTQDTSSYFSVQGASRRTGGGRADGIGPSHPLRLTDEMNSPSTKLGKDATFFVG